MIRIYGRQERASSFSVVTRGWDGALTELSDRFGQSEIAPQVVTLTSGIPSTSCDMCIVTDPHMFAISRAFDHSRRFMVLAPHSSALPESLVEGIVASKTILLPPSEFCAQILRQACPKNQVEVVLHGVDSQFRLVTEAQVQQRAATSDLGNLRGPGTNFLHMAAGDLERKGTLELVDAFLASVARGFDATLTCVLAGRDRVQVSMRGFGLPRCGAPATSSCSPP